MPFYAHYDNNGKVVGVTQLSGDSNDPNSVEIEIMDMSLMGQIYDAKTKTFSPDPTPTPAPTKPVSQQILERLTALETKVDAISAASAAEIIKAG
jgi:hypothetical protein